MTKHVPNSVLCMCLGNTYTHCSQSLICRSNFRKGVMIKMFHIFWRIDHAVTSTYEIGNPPDYREENCMKQHGMPMNHMAQQIIKEDFTTFDYISYINENNLRDLKRKFPKVKYCKAKIELLRSYIHQNNFLLKIPVKGMTLTLRWCTSNVSGAAEHFWKRPTEAALMPCCSQQWQDPTWGSGFLSQCAKVQ